MADLIERQAAILALLEEGQRSKRYRFGDVWELNFAEIREAIATVPYAQPEIIRCKECRHYEWMSNRVPNEQTWFCHKWNAETGKDDYCSYAERRKE